MGGQICGWRQRFDCEMRGAAGFDPDSTPYADFKKEIRVKISKRVKLLLCVPTSTAGQTATMQLLVGTGYPRVSDGCVPDNKSIYLANRSCGRLNEFMSAHYHLG
jgi:hypothetical protein